MASKSRRTGLWLIGARGGVATTAIVGIEAIRRGWVPPTGLIGHLPPFHELGLQPLTEWVIGGHEIRNVSLADAARELYEGSALFSPEILKKVTPFLRACDRNIRSGSAAHSGATIAAMAGSPESLRKRTAAQWAGRLAADIVAFQKRHRLSSVVVLNVASTEPPFTPGRVHQTWKTLEKALNTSTKTVLPDSSLYALAAIQAGAAYINFTPSTGINLPALRDLAGQRGIPYMGADGKTGETLMKSVLAPMFAQRNLPVLSWVGHNIFGNRDGLVLDDPRNKAAKVLSKDHLVSEMLGYTPRTLVSIEYIESMQDWKTAWDHIHFAGFLNTKMTLQFIWQGCDSILAAPLVIELARFAELARRRGESGPLRHLACFFKSPLGVREQGFARQYETLLQYATLPTRK